MVHGSWLMVNGSWFMVSQRGETSPRLGGSRHDGELANPEGLGGLPHERLANPEGSWFCYINY